MATGAANAYPLRDKDGNAIDAAPVDGQRALLVSDPEQRRLLEEVLVQLVILNESLARLTAALAKE